ncbi:hypothetical protein [Cyclobacterium marinum]|uniref:Uncharacterized protein n=1 Tax=Cyclobacterium marinum (strain ATCC 25205 / DSM 745 / LMG 13164 / NCIMB 1802) TaxID=880070 RepID=G0J3B5_CYCMS|nr:hypothetical protein [Cyclobacterium marinum]AEL24056.1 hypothetical protein Cycma_0275 [Cyclobacterium marinum DSM 745]
MSKLKPNQIILDGNIITELPILFQGELIRANMEGRKTQTRRGKKLDYINECSVCWRYDGIETKGNTYTHVFARFNKDDSVLFFEKINSPYGKPGDLLWVRETWRHFLSPDHQITKFDYKANWSEGIISHPKNKGIWRPSIHMPKTAARIWLMVEEIGMERVHDISKEDAIAEGVRYIQSENIFNKGYFNYLRQDLDEPNFNSPISSFNSLWVLINGEASFEANPWVWVVKYRILSKNGRPNNETILKNHLKITRKEAANV